MAGLGRIRRGTSGWVKYGPIFAVMALLATAQGAQAAERKYLMASFTDIIVIGDMQVNIVTGKSPSAKASGDKRTLDALRLERTGNTMLLRVQPILNNEKSKPITEPLIVNITNREIRNMALRGNAKIAVSSLKQDTSANVGIDGGGEIKISNLIVDSFTAGVNGNGAIIIGSGKVRAAKVDMQGSGMLDASALSVQHLKLSQNGNATGKFLVEGKAEISNIGAGNITVRGEGLCFIKKAGSANIECAHIGKE